MGVSGLADLVLQDKTLAAAMADARGGAVPALDLTAPGAVRPFVVKGLVDAGRTVLAVAATAREAEDLVSAHAGRMDPAEVADDVGRRLAVLRRLRHPGTDASNGPLKVVVAPVRSVLQLDRARTGLQQRLGDERDVLLAADVLAHDHELVAAEPGHRVAVAHHPREPGCELGEQLVAAAVTE